MPALVNNGGDNIFYTGVPLHSGDSGLVFSICSHVEVFSPPRKRSRISGPFTFNGEVEEKRTSIDILPDECLFEIFRRLPGGREKSVSACVSKRWLTVMSSIRISEFYSKSKSERQLNDSSKTANTDEDMIDEDIEVECDGCLSRCVESKKAADVRLAAIAVGTSSRGGLEKLSIRGSNSHIGVSDRGLSAVARGCPSLKVLSLWSVPSITDEGLFEISRECHSLEKLDLCQLPSISDRGLAAIAENCPNLNALTIESCPNIGDESLLRITKFCHKLQSVTIIDCGLVGDHGISSLLSSASSVLTKVKLQSLKVTDYSLAVIGYFGRTTTNLVLSGLQKVTQRGFWVMAKAKGLQSLLSLTITSCGGMGDLGLEAVGSGIPNLKQLSIRKSCFVSDNGLIAFAKAATGLECLQLEECNRITLSGILTALSSSNSKMKSVSLVKCMGIKDISTEHPSLSPCRSLRVLSVRSCPGFGNSSLSMIGKLCPQLHNLDLSGLRGITDDGLLPFLECCQDELSKVHLSDCSNLTDEVVLALSRLHGESLELLHLDGCHRITDTSLSALADSCPLLSDLDLSRCSITDSGVIALSNGVQLGLQVLSLSGCSMISNKSLSALKKLGRTLVGLNIQRCSSVSHATVEILSEKLWKCDLLY